jgi:hypothetical protein
VGLLVYLTLAARSVVWSSVEECKEGLHGVQHELCPAKGKKSTLMKKKITDCRKTPYQQTRRPSQRGCVGWAKLCVYTPRV